MSERGKGYATWAAVLVASLVAGGGLGLFAAKAAAAAEVRPVEGRVSRLEAQREDDKERLGRIESKIDKIIDRVK